ncbi:hypothetical protein ACX928_20470 [Enterobacter roggenkampii]
MRRVDEFGFDGQRRVILPVDAEAEFQALLVSCLLNRFEQRMELFNLPGGVNRDDVDGMTGQVADYCYEHSMLPSELQLMICEPNYPPEFDLEQHCEEIMPDGDDYYCLPQAVRDAAEALNKALKESAPVSWSASNRVAIVSDDMLTDEQKAEIMAERAA